MWTYERRLQYPVKITKCNPKLAQVIISQFGGPDGELSASMRYLSQRYSSTNRQVSGILTDIGSEASEMFLRACRAFSEANALAVRPVNSLCRPQPYSSI